jgi:uncharacterized protein
LLRQAAEGGHAEAQYNLPVALLMGARGVRPDTIEANRWLEKSAVQGWASAQFKLAYSYLMGRGMRSDTSTAFKWFESAAKAGDIESQYTVIGMLLNGHGTARDTNAALEWTRRLAVMRNPSDLESSGLITSARLNLAYLYLEGAPGIPTDSAAGYKWLLIANENKVDMSWHVQQKMIGDIRSIESRLPDDRRKRIAAEAAQTLGRPLMNTAKLYKFED